MQIKINVDEKIEDMVIDISCSHLTPELENVLATLRMLERKLTVTREGETFFLDVEKVVYVESIDKKTFVYTALEVYESAFRLYELEQQLDECGFFRASKSCLIQLKIQLKLTQLKLLIR